MRTLAFAEEQSVHPPLLHVVDGLSRDGRIRRAERLRRDLAGHAIVLGGLDAECRCAGIGLHSMGSAPWRSIAGTVARACRGFAQAGGVMPIPTAWSDELGLELTRTCSRVILVSDGPLPDDVGSDSIGRILTGAGRAVRPGCLEVIAPDEQVARAWAHLGAASTRIVRPCGLPSGARITTDPEAPISVVLVPREAEGERALELYHRIGLVHLGGSRIRALLEPDDPSFDRILEYVTKIGIEESFDALKRADSRPQLALVSSDGDVGNDERVLDLAARGIGIVAVVPDACAKESSPSDGIVLMPRSDVNSGCRHVLELALDPERRVAFQVAAAAFAAERSARDWSSVMGVATAGRAEIPG